MDGITLQNLFACAPTWPVQLSLLALQSTIWFFFVPAFATKVAKPYVDAHPMSEQWGQLNKVLWKEGYFCDFSLEKAREFGCLLIAIICQHLFGGILCLPAVMARGAPSSLAASLARHGALCEAGWECQDGLYRVYQVIRGGKDNRGSNPPALLTLLSVHHAMGLSMVLPMNVYYSDNYLYFHLVFILQVAAGVALLTQQWGFTLDTTTAVGLGKMKVGVTVTFLTLWYTRVLAFVPDCYMLLSDFWGSSSAFFVGGCIATVLMALLNVLLVGDATVKFKKFVAMRVEEEMKQPLIQTVEQGAEANCKVSGDATQEGK